MKELSKDYQVKKERLLKKLECYCINKEQNIKDLSIENIEDFMLNNMTSINRSAYYQNVKLLNIILKDNGNDIVVDSRQYVNMCCITRDEQYLTKKEVMEVCDALMNYQDKFIIYMLFNKVMGKRYQDLLNIKISDVAKDYSYIMINGRKMMCDDYLKEILEMTILQEEYYKYVSNEIDMRTADYFVFNMSSPYVIKSKPSKKNCDGLEPVSYQALQRRLTKLQEVYEEECGEKIILTGKSLVKSGVLYDMFLKEVSDGTTWEMETIDNYFKMNNIKINVAECYRSYNMRYHDTTRI